MATPAGAAATIRALPRPSVRAYVLRLTDKDLADLAAMRTPNFAGEDPDQRYRWESASRAMHRGDAVAAGREVVVDPVYEGGTLYFCPSYIAAVIVREALRGRLHQAEIVFDRWGDPTGARSVVITSQLYDPPTGGLSTTPAATCPACSNTGPHTECDQHADCTIVECGNPDCPTEFCIPLEEKP